MKFKARYKVKRTYEPILPGPKDWPVVRLSKNRKGFVEEVTDESVGKIKEIARSRSALIEELETTLFRERLRVKQNPWKVDPDDELSFWKKVKTRLLELSTDKESRKEEEILRDIVGRYADEIAGNFKPTHYRFARNMATFGFARLLNASRIKKFGAFWRNDYSLKDKIHVTGEIAQLRNLAKKGTIVIVPTHFSNLDSILIGWVIYTLGLPPFIYGAGLNLFNINILAYFMNSLGAYKVDRRKKNLLYLETLKTYSREALRKGCHSLFFPGGTRSRSGHIEKQLKMGLLGTAIEAQRLNYQKAQDEGSEAEKIFIVPVSLNYHFVLEAPGLIDEYLKRQGQERYYVESDEFSSSYKILTFLFKFFTKGSDISVSVGQAMDVMGNHVDQNGQSLDKQNRRIDTKDYFMSGGKIDFNKQREEQYTQMLSEHIVREYHKINRVFSSHLVCYVAFQIIKKRNPNLDIFSLLRLPDDELIIDYNEFKDMCKKLRKKIFQKVLEGKMTVAPHMHEKMKKVIEHGLLNAGMYHSKRPIIKNKEGQITTMDLNILYYYHNRLDGYGLEKYIK